MTFTAVDGNGTTQEQEMDEQATKAITLSGFPRSLRR
jgi:hypothetical protein